MQQLRCLRTKAEDVIKLEIAVVETADLAVSYSRQNFSLLAPIESMLAIKKSEQFVGAGLIRGMQRIFAFEVRFVLGAELAPDMCAGGVDLLEDPFAVVRSIRVPHTKELEIDLSKYAST